MIVLWGSCRLSVCLGMPASLIHPLRCTNERRFAQRPRRPPLRDREGRLRRAEACRAMRASREADAPGLLRPLVHRARRRAHLVEWRTITVGDHAEATD